MTEPCPACGSLEGVHVADAWTDGRFTLAACCEVAHDEALLELDDLARNASRGRANGARARRSGFARGFELETGIGGGRLVDDGLGGLVVVPRLEVVPCGPIARPGDPRALTRDEVRAFVAKHHRHNRPAAGWRWGYAVYSGEELVAVAMVGRPVARRLDADEVVEVTRVCVDPTVEPERAFGACSAIYAAACRDARARGFGRVVTYTLEDEPAAACRGAGFVPAATTAGGSWNRPSRARTDSAPTCPKVRWERELAA